MTMTMTMTPAELVAPAAWAGAYDPSIGEPPPGKCVVAVDDEGRDCGYVAAAVWPLPDGRWGCTAIGRRTLGGVDAALDAWLPALLVVGRGLLRRWSPATPLIAYGAKQTPPATQLMRALIGDRVIAHDGAPVLNLAVASARVLADSGGICRSVSGAYPTAAAKCTAWALDAAHRWPLTTTPTSAVRGRTVT